MGASPKAKPSRPKCQAESPGIESNFEPSRTVRGWRKEIGAAPA